MKKVIIFIISILAIAWTGYCAYSFICAILSLGHLGSEMHCINELCHVIFSVLLSAENIILLSRGK